MAAPLIKLQNVGLLYITTFCSWLSLLLLLILEDDCGGEVDGGESDENGSESDGMVRLEADRSWGGDGSSSEGGDGALLDIIVERWDDVEEGRCRFERLACSL